MTTNVATVAPGGRMDNLVTVGPASHSIHARPSQTQRRTGTTDRETDSRAG